MKYRQKRKALVMAAPCLILLAGYLFLNISPQKKIDSDSEKSTPFMDVKDSDPSCANYNVLPVKSTESFKSEKRFKKIESHPSIKPTFYIGSVIKNVVYHMTTDTAMFEVIAEYLKSNKGITFDIGANQGFYTYFLATLGFDVHAFEIDKTNFKALQHGLLYNPTEVANRVQLYSMGLSDKNALLEKRGSSYDGYLVPAKKHSIGSVLSITSDCFAQHTKPDLEHVAFVKIDVEGFEIAVLKGAQNSLFHPDVKIGSLLMEVGPSRWERGNIGVDDGIREMKRMRNRFQKSFIFIRTGGSHEKSCSSELSAHLSDKGPRIFPENKLYAIETDEYEGLLRKMHETKSDCNFWFVN